MSGCFYFGLSVWWKRRQNPVWIYTVALKLYYHGLPLSNFAGILMSRLFRFSLLLFLPALVSAAESVPNEPGAVPEPPCVPAPVQSGEWMEPDITIIRKGKDTIQEFRRNGKLYMVKIQPQIGPAYYMLDTNGDGEMDVKKNDLDENTNINKWILFEWD